MTKYSILQFEGQVHFSVLNSMCCLVHSSFHCDTQFTFVVMCAMWSHRRPLCSDQVKLVFSPYNYQINQLLAYRLLDNCFSFHLREADDQHCTQVSWLSAVGFGSVGFWCFGCSEHLWAGIRTFLMFYLLCKIFRG